MSKKVFIVMCTALAVVFMIVCTGFIMKEENAGNLREDPMTEKEIREKRSDAVIITENDDDSKVQTRGMKRAEFDISGADSIMIPVSDSKTYNRELQIYLPDQADIRGYNITICAEKIGMNYVSGKLESKMAFRYGSFSFRISLVEGKGIFPAVWMMPQDNEKLPEIDIFEMIGNYPDRFYGVLHYLEDGKRKQKDAENKYEGEIPEDIVLDFEWSEDHLIWKADGEEMLRITEGVPDIPVYLIMNLAVGGIWPGNPAEDTAFPSYFEIEILDFSPEEMYIRD